MKWTFREWLALPAIVFFAVLCLLFWTDDEWEQTSLNKDE